MHRTAPKNKEISLPNVSSASGGRLCSSPSKYQLPHDTFKLLLEIYSMQFKMLPLPWCLINNHKTVFLWLSTGVLEAFPQNSSSTSFSSFYPCMNCCWQNLIWLAQVHLITHQETAPSSSLVCNCGVYFLTSETPGCNPHNQNHKGPAVWRRSGMLMMVITSVSCDDLSIFFQPVFVEDLLHSRH